MTGSPKKETRPPDAPRAILAGATGLVGRYLLRELLTRTRGDGDPAYREVVVLTRRPLPDALPAGLDGDRVQEVEADFTRLGELGEAVVADHVFCALGTTIRKAGSRERFRAVDHGLPMALARATRAAGARHFGLVSSMGARSDAGTFYLRVKGELEEELRGVGFPSVGIVRPSVIGGPRGEFRPAEAVGRVLLSLVPGRLRTVHAADIAAAMVTLALEEAPGVQVLESEEIRRLAKG
ncbi:MAG: NAD(P)H-binding protein [Gemmatimonadales bacterium]|nr:MAG: NAD(P)H-binding protein [Gemmatimonadales bacterium]